MIGGTNLKSKGQRSRSLGTKT